MSGPFVNKHNSQFIQPRIDSKEGVRCARSGGSYGATMSTLASSAKSGLGRGYAGYETQKACNSGQKGGYNYDSDFGGPVSYGYTKQGAALASQLKGSYTAVNKNRAQTQCGAGKSRKKRRRRRRKSRRSRKRTRRRRRRHRRRTRRRRKSKRGGGKKCCGRFRKKIRTRRRQRGGAYKQAGSNTPNTPSYSTPNSSATRATAAGSFSRYNNCRDNYNHYNK